VLENQEIRGLRVLNPYEKKFAAGGGRGLCIAPIRSMGCCWRPAGSIFPGGFGRDYLQMNASLLVLNKTRPGRTPYRS
jgi:hypothetical protein